MTKTTTLQATEAVDMECPRCANAVGADAAFCGNCGLAIRAYSHSGHATKGRQARSISSYGRIATTTTLVRIPGYARPRLHPVTNTKAIASMVCGLVGLVGILVVPLFSLVFGVAGIVLSSIASRSSARSLRIMGFTLSCLAVVAGLAFLALVVTQDPAIHTSATTNSAQVVPTPAAISSVTLTTPCYSLRFVGQITVDNAPGSCTMDAYNGASPQESTNIYRVVTTDEVITDANFSSLSAAALEAGAATNIPDSTLSSLATGVFAGSPAYYVYAESHSPSILFAAVAVWHKTTTSSQLVVLMQVTHNENTNLPTLETNWYWN